MKAEDRNGHGDLAGEARTANPRGGARNLNPVVARCGYRCDLCPAYRENIHSSEDQQRTSDGWFKYFGFRIPPGQICCDGRRDERPEGRRIDTTCPIRPCAIARGMNTCAQAYVIELATNLAAPFSAGIDLVLAFIESVAGEDVAGKVQFGAEYYPSDKFFGAFQLSQQAPAYLRKTSGTSEPEGRR